jgi:RNA polymerase sigma-70 factor, ECF subfamily
MRGYALPAEADERRITAATDAEDAFDALYRAYAPALRAYCQARLGNAVDAEDACHEAIIRAHGALPRFKRGKRLWPWLATIANNVCRDMQRRQATVAAHTTYVDVVVDDLDEVAAARTRRAILADALAGMPERYRSHVRMCDLEGFSYSEVAALDGTTVASVRSTLHRARAVLRERVQDTAHRRHEWPLPAFLPLGFSRLRARLARARATATPVAEPISRFDTLLGLVTHPALAQGVFGVAALLGVGLDVMVSQHADASTTANVSSFATESVSSSTAATAPGAMFESVAGDRWIPSAYVGGSSGESPSSVPGFWTPGGSSPDAAAPDAPVVFLAPSSPSAPGPYVLNVDAPPPSAPPSPVQVISAPAVNSSGNTNYNVALPNASVSSPSGPQPVDLGPTDVNICPPPEDGGAVTGTLCPIVSDPQPPSVEEPALSEPQLSEPELSEPDTATTLTLQ